MSISFFNLINSYLALNSLMSFNNLVNFYWALNLCMGGTNIRCLCMLEDVDKDDKFVPQSQ